MHTIPIWSGHFGEWGSVSPFRDRRLLALHLEANVAVTYKSLNLMGYARVRFKKVDWVEL